MGISSRQPATASRAGPCRMMKASGSTIQSSRRSSSTPGIAESAPLPDLADNHLSALRGMIAIREGDLITANQLYVRALRGCEKRSKGRRYIFEPSILLAQGYL